MLFFRMGLFILDYCAKASTVAVSAITGLLLQTLMLPSPGQSNLSEAIHHPRFAPLMYYLESCNSWSHGGIVDTRGLLAISIAEIFKFH